LQAANNNHSKINVENLNKNIANNNILISNAQRVVIARNE